MKALGDRSIAALIRRVLEAAWWLVAVSLVLLGVLMVCTLFVNLERDNLTMDLPVALVLNAPARAGSTVLHSEARIEKLSGNLRFPVRRGAILSGSVFLVVVLFAIQLWGLTQLRHIFRALSRGLVFLPENARRIRWVGFAVLCGEVARMVLVFVWSYYTSQHFTADGVRFVPSFDFRGLTLLSGLAILVIAEVFREGVRLQEEQSLTI
ncbi:MAG: DUF2975 domain-containing protein [Paludibaculum sp.]